MLIRVLAFATICWLGSLAAVPAGAQTDDPGGSSNNPVISRDAIGLRVVPNPEHHSPLQWYDRNITIKGAPQSFIVDGYEAVRDGRTVYVNAANIVAVNRCSNNPQIICTSNQQCPGQPQLESFWHRFSPIARAQQGPVCAPAPDRPELYTNIYIISYNQNPEAATTDIFGQLLQFWKFNSTVKSCSNDPERSCVSDADCPAGAAGIGEAPQGSCQYTGLCSATTVQACVLSSDCPAGEFCLSKKSAVIRDVKRLSDLRTVKNRLEAYVQANRRYPALEAGTYLTNRTVSTWPSWSTAFANTLGGPVPSDPINRLGRCHPDQTLNQNYNPVTCWDEATRQFSVSGEPLALPSGSNAYYYQYTQNPNRFRLCALAESGYIKGGGVGTPLCETGNTCFANCTNRTCGSDGCGGSCGTCTGGRTCSNNGVCYSPINPAEQ